MPQYRNTPRTHPDRAGQTYRRRRRRERERSEATLFGNLSLSPSVCLTASGIAQSETFDFVFEIPTVAQSALSERPESDVLIFPTHRVPERRARGDSGATAGFHKHPLHADKILLPAGLSVVFPGSSFRIPRILQ